MKNALIRIFSTVTILVLFVVTTSGQIISKGEFERIVDRMICDFTDLSLKEQKGQPHYQQFKDNIQPNCTYYMIRPFLREVVKPAPAQTLEIVNILHDYKERYNSEGSNQRLYNILTDVFEENAVVAFSKNHTRSFPDFKSGWEAELRDLLKEEEVPEEVIVTETVPEVDDVNALDKEFKDIQQNPIENNVDSPNDYNTDPAEERGSSRGISNSFLFLGFLLLLIAYALYLFYQRNKGAITQKFASKKPKTNVVTKTQKTTSKSWLSKKPKKETYADKIANLQALIQSQKSIMLNIKEDIGKMHLEINDLTEKAGFEIIDEHIKQLSQKLDEVEQKQKELILVLDSHSDEEMDDFDDESIDDTNDYEELLKDATQDLQEDSSAITETTDDDNFSHVIPVIQMKKLTSPPDLFFMPVPNKDGSFDAENWTAKFEDTESVYRFEMINNYEAKFQFHNEKKTVKRAISGYDIYIKPVCKALNAFNTNATEIRTQVQGVVYRDGDTWKLKEKALIYYQ